MLKNKAYQLVIFDCDGTLVDSEPVTNGLVAQMIQERGISVSRADCLEMFAGKTIKDIVSFIQIQGINETLSSFEKEYRARCNEVFKKELRPVTGARSFIESLAIPYCVASNGPRVKMNLTLPICQLNNFFDDRNTFSAYDIQAWKPDPDLFLHASNRMKVDPSSSLVIEDTWSGIMGAVNAGIDVWALNPHDDDRLFISGVPNFASMAEIEKTFHLISEK